MWKTIEGRWKQFSDEISRRCPKLTDRDLTECAGDRQMLIARLRKHYRMSQAEAEAEVGRAERSLSRLPDPRRFVAPASRR